MKFFRKIENIFAASAFAEAGEHETARQMAAEEVEGTKEESKVTSVRPTKPVVGEAPHALKRAGSES